MKTPVARCAAACVAVAALAVSVSQAPRADQIAKKQDSVTLKFGWPGNLHGKVDYRIRKIRKGGGETRNMQISGSYVLRTTPVRDGLRVSAHGGSVNVSNAQRPRSRGATLQRLLAQVIKSPPSFVVDSGGEFQRLEGLQEFRGNLRQAVNQMTADMPEQARAQVGRAIAPMMSEAQLTAQVANNWNRDVGAWLGAKLDHGDLYETRHQAPMPALGNRKVPMVTTFKFIRRLPCRTGESKARCVELEMRSFIDAKGLQKALKDYLSNVMGGNPEVPVIKNLSTTTTVRLVTEPRTLVPHQVHTREVTTALVAFKGREIPTERIQETRTIYTY